MTDMTASQLRDALAYIEALSDIEMPDTEGWGQGLRLVLPDAIPLRPDYSGEAPVAWLVANDFNGYNLTTEEP